MENANKVITKVFSVCREIVQVYARSHRKVKCLKNVKKNQTSRQLDNKQNGRLEPAYFSPEDKNFDHHMQTVKNETTV